MILSVPGVILCFYMFISNSFSNMVAFTALTIAVTFIVISMGILGWILDQPTGTRAMKEIADPIKEGSEGFFITQYGTIFKIAFVTSIGLFFIYAVREPVPGSRLNDFLTTT